jgi:hypothetical protein
MMMMMMMNVSGQRGVRITTDVMSTPIPSGWPMA